MLLRLVPIWLLAACAGAPAEVPADQAPPSDISLQGVTARVWHGPTLRAQATAARLDFQRQGSLFVATGARAVLLERGATVAAPRAEGDLSAHQVEGSGGVRLLGRDGLVGTTERARFDGQAGDEGAASSRSAVAVEAPGLKLSASGFQFDVKSQQCTFEGPVVTSLRGTSP